MRDAELRGSWTRPIALVGLVLAAILIAACGSDTVGGAREGETEVAQSGPLSGTLAVSNWPGYIDPGKNGEGTLEEFEKETGVAVDYKIDVNDNDQFFGKVQPLLAEGESGGRDIMVVTDWMAEKMHNLGYLQDINPDDLPTAFENLRADLQAPDFDPDRSYSMPWQSGMTGVWVDTAKAPEITSVNDLFDPKYAGKVTMLTEMRDTVPLVMKADGIDPATATKEDWLAAIDKIGEAADSGQIRRFTGNDYTEDLTRGNVVATIGWSGDASLIANDDAEWRMPDEGCMLWSDNMVIPVGAPNTAAALEFMDFVYEPEVQADIAEWVNYVTPVEGVKEILAERDPKLAQSQLIFPDAQFTSSCTTQVSPPGDDEDVAEVTEAFEDVKNR